MYIYQNTVLRCGKYTHISRWVGHCSVYRDAHYLVSQSLIVSVHTDICKLGLENHFLDLGVNVIVIIVIGLKELVRQMIVFTELRGVVFVCCGVVFKQVVKFGCTKIVINCFRSLYTVQNILQNCSYKLQKLQYSTVLSG